ncbi:MAG TPA: M23 family metallopeptidase [Gammaproteobacteria bacterium]|nr:M23 family metallopeptidase [Gammaproteobacteria bacterium]
MRNLLLFLCLLPVVGYCANADTGRLKLHGDFVQGGLVRGHVPPGSTVYFDNEKIMLTDAGGFLIGFARDEPASVPLKVVLPSGEKLFRAIDVKQREYDIQRINGLPDDEVNIPPADLKRIRADGAAVWKARNHNSTRTDFLSGWIMPAKGPITGVYGSQRILNGEPRRPHYGLDIAGPTGTPVIAPADGVVTMAQNLLLSGNVVIIDHGHGLSSTFLHMSSLAVEEGEPVKRGDKIGEIGQTGRATGPHLDWRMNLFDRRLDPALLLDE